MSDVLTDFERAVLRAFLTGDDARLQILQAQLSVCVVTGRRHTGVSSFTDLAVPEDVDRMSPPAITMGDLDLRVEGLPEGATAMLFVRAGALARLEFVTNAGHWPEQPVVREIGYFRYAPTVRGGYTLVPVTDRDPATLALQLMGHKSGPANSSP